jgi:amino acid transporter
MKRDDLQAELAKDAEELHRFGYAQQLLRKMGGFSNFALSFSIISILTGAVQLYDWGLKWGGPLGMHLGWLLVAGMTLLVAASLAELASAYPTAGALYHWSALLGGPGAGFVTAWLSTLGMFATIAGIDYGLAQFLTQMLGLGGGRTTVLTLYALLLVSHGALNHAGIGVVEILNRASAWYHMAGTLLLCAALALFAPHKPAAFLLTTVRASGHGLAYTFALGLLQAQWTFTGYDASACVTEETVDPRHTVPRALFLSVAVSALFGFLLLLAVTLSIPSLDAALKSDNAFITVLDGALGTRLGGLFIWVAMGAMWFCGLGSVTSNSRTLFAFARDGGLGRGRRFAAVSQRYRTPHRAVWLSVAMAFVVALWGGAYEIIVAISTIALYAAYGLPVAMAVLAARRGRLERGPWSLGRWSLTVRALALGWVAVILVLFVLPPHERVGYTFAACLVLIGGFWLLWGRGHFKGPPPPQR